MPNSCKHKKYVNILDGTMWLVIHKFVILVWFVGVGVNSGTFILAKSH